MSARETMPMPAVPDDAEPLMVVVVCLTEVGPLVSLRGREFLPEAVASAVMDACAGAVLAHAKLIWAAA